ncbi:helix-turn-helix domain-containing protein [Brevundimonas sp.]|uniref:helix-turn-helix transcriptional regulator n=1 Tax=Brevundimonas sp. TaxID=1871086 RepID=UPI001A1CA3CD|nr:helix-turn-helix domain-containing protein [Brevundimonas sp.]MBJ7484203.1 helix-turn-helix domain-containing protein [Brevundimonas sp.]
MSDAEPQDLAAAQRLTTAEVMALARISRATLWRRVASGRLPTPIDHGRQSLFARLAVIAALTKEPVPMSHTLETERRLAALRRRRHKGG